MTKAQTKAAQTAYTGMTVNELIALAKAEPAKLASIQAHARVKHADLTARSANPAKLAAWASIVDGTLTGWPKATPAKKAVAKQPKAAKANKDEVLALLQALIASM
jgi:N-acetyl-anhydromuramyl-L-alanine amidase AmpD